MARSCIRPTRQQSVRILDSHVHFVDPLRAGGVAWPPADSPLYRSWSTGDFLRVNEAATCIAVETSRRPADDDWLLRLAESEESIEGVVLNLQPDGTGFDDRFQSALASDKFVGVRLRPIEHYDFSSPLLQHSFGLLEKQTKSVEFGAKTDALKEQFAKLATQFSSNTWILDHCGHPANDQPPTRAWRNSMKRIAACPNAVIKVSALPNDAIQAQRLLDELLSQFGARRLLYGSNWPVSTITKPDYDAIAVCADFFGAQSDVFFAGNARRTYGLAQGGLT